jgi:hypothetical protein
MHQSLAKKSDACQYQCEGKQKNKRGGPEGHADNKHVVEPVIEFDNSCNGKQEAGAKTNKKKPKFSLRHAVIIVAIERFTIRAVLPQNPLTC